MTYLDFLEQKVLLERLVIGLEEPVLIKGLGELSAKIDSGNGGYNVIHGTDFHQQGNELMFTTHDSFGHEKKMQATVIDTIEVNMGGGNIESRPVIELDIKFAGEDYKKIPFSVSDRSSNTNPILISKGFVENELEALIDVGAMNISHDKIDVVYGEGIGGFLKGAASMAGKGIWGGIKAVGSGIKNAGNYLKGGQNVNLFAPVAGAAKPAAMMAGGAAGLAGGALAGILKGAWMGAKAIINASNIVKEDVDKVRKALPNSVLPKNLQKDSNINLDNTVWKQYQKFDSKNARIVQLVSFKGRAGDVQNGHVVSGMEQRIKNWKDALKASEKQAKDSKGNNKNAQEQEENILAQAFGTLGGDLGDMGVPQSPQEIQKQTEEKQQQENGEPAPEQEKLPQGNISNQETEKIKDMTTQLGQLKNFVLYFIPAVEGLESNAEKDMKEICESGKLDKIFIKLFNMGDISKGTITPVVRDLAKTIKSFQKKTAYLQGSFALGLGELGKRTIELFDNANEAVVMTINDDIDRNENQSADPKIIKAIEEKMADLDSSLNNTIEAVQNQSVVALTSKNCQRTISQLKSRIKDFTENPQFVEKYLKPFEENGDIPTAIVKNYLNANNLQQISDAMAKTYGKNWIVKGFDEFSDKLAKIDGINDILEKIGSTSAPQETQGDDRTPKFNELENEVESGLQGQGENPEGTTDEQPAPQAPATETPPPAPAEAPAEKSKDNKSENTDSDQQEIVKQDQEDNIWINDKLSLLKNKGII